MTLPVALMPVAALSRDKLLRIGWRGETARETLRGIKSVHDIPRFRLPMRGVSAADARFVLTIGIVCISAGKGGYAE